MFRDEPSKKDFRNTLMMIVINEDHLLESDYLNPEDYYMKENNKKMRADLDTPYVRPPGQGGRRGGQLTPHMRSMMGSQSMGTGRSRRRYIAGSRRGGRRGGRKKLELDVVDVVK